MSNNSSKIRNLAKDTGLFAISSFGSKILVFLLTPVYTSILATKEFGIADLITTVVNLTYPIFTLAISEATLRYSMEKKENKNKVLVNSLYFVIGSSFFLVVMMPFAKYLYAELAGYWIVFVGIYFVFNVHNVLSNFCKGMGNTKLFAIQGLVQTMTIVLCNIVFLLIIKIGLKGYLLSIFAGYFIPIVLMIFSGKIYRYFVPLSLDAVLIKKMLRYCFPMIPTLVAWSINTNIDKFMIIGFCGLGASGIYSVAYKIPTLMTTVLSVFLQAWQLSAINSYGDADESEYYTSIYKALNIVSVIGCFVIILSAQLLARVLFANDFYLAWRFVPFLTISALFSSNSGFISAAFKAAKKTNNLFYSVIIGSVVNVIFNYFLLTRIGTIGAAIATMIGFETIWLIRIVMVQKIVKIRIDVLKTFLNHATIICAAFALSFEIHHYYLVVGALFSLTIILNIKDIISIIVTLEKYAKKYRLTRR